MSAGVPVSLQPIASMLSGPNARFKIIVNPSLVLSLVFLVEALEDPSVVGLELQPLSPPDTLYLMPADQAVVYGPGLT